MKNIFCNEIENNKWVSIRIRVDGKIFPCCIYMAYETEFDEENLGNSAEDFEKNIINNHRKTCYRECSINKNNIRWGVVKANAEKSDFTLKF